MSIVDRVTANLPGLAKGPGLPGPHNVAWGNRHAGPHGGEGGRGFPGGPPGLALGLDRGNGGPPGLAHGLDRGHGGPPGLGIDRPNVGHGNGHNGVGAERPDGTSWAPGQPGAERPNAAIPPPGHGVERPQHPHNGPPGQVVRDVLAGPRQVPASPGSQGHGPALPPGAALASLNPLAQQAPAGAMQAAAALAQAGGQAMTAQASAQSTLMQQPGQMPLARADAAPLAQPRADAAASPGGMSRGEAAVPAARADAMSQLRPADTTMADRMAAMQRTQAGTAALAHSAAAATTATAAAAAGSTMATAPAAHGVDARNATALGAVNDRGQPVARPDLAGTYTGEGPHRRRAGHGLRALPGGLSTLLAALGLQGSTAASGRDPAAIERELREATMQWLFWLLAIIAYGCVAFAVVGLLPSGSLGGGGGGGGVAGSRAWAGGFALAGLVAGVGAWWFARVIPEGHGRRRGRPDGRGRSGP